MEDGFKLDKIFRCTGPEIEISEIVIVEFSEQHVVHRKIPR